MRSLEVAQRKLYDDRADWAGVDRAAALDAPHALDLLREACLVESYLPVYTGKMMALFWDDLDATAVFTIEAAEAYSHYYLLRRYLETVDYQPITDAEVIALREKERAEEYTEPIRELVNFMGTEHFAAQFFSDLMDMTTEPVLRTLLPRFAEEETLHSQFAFDLLAARLANDPSLSAEVVEHARNFRHVGAYVADHVSPAGSDNVRTIQAFNHKFVRLLGKPLSEFLIGGAVS